MPSEETRSTGTSPPPPCQQPGTPRMPGCQPPPPCQQPGTPRTPGCQPPLLASSPARHVRLAGATCAPRCPLAPLDHEHHTSPTHEAHHRHAPSHRPRVALPRHAPSWRTTDRPHHRPSPRLCVWPSLPGTRRRGGPSRWFTPASRWFTPSLPPRYASAWRSKVRCSRAVDSMFLAQFGGRVAVHRTAADGRMKLQLFSCVAPACLPAYPPTNPPTHPPTHLPTHPPTYLPAYLPTSAWRQSSKPR